MDLSNTLYKLNSELEFPEYCVESLVSSLVATLAMTELSDCYLCA